jgi:hypothetical protein
LKQRPVLLTKKENLPYYKNSRKMKQSRKRLTQRRRLKEELKKSLLPNRLRKKDWLSRRNNKRKKIA